MTESDYEARGFARFERVVDPRAAGDALRWLRRNRSRTDIPSTLDLFNRADARPIKLRRLWQADPLFWSAFLERSGVLPLVVRALGERPFLIRSAAFIKYPRSDSTVGWHCDEDLWGHASAAGLTAWVPLTPVPAGSGCLRFLPGSHKRPPGALYVDLSHPYHKVMDVSALGEPVELCAEVGDCILMDKRAVHSSGRNQTARERTGLVLAFAVCPPAALNESAVEIGSGGCREIGGPA
ncbi:MAG TPA: phytanoyl-CoA dioxygenase family protein [Allosphingosinicella sp.]|jgi:hypothetical protein